MQQDLKSTNFCLNKAIDVAQNRTLGVETDVYIWHYKLSLDFDCRSYNSVTH